MPFLKHMQSINLKESLNAFAAMTMLLFYVVGNIPIEVIHQFVHAHDSQVFHSNEQEKDPCHITLFHEGRDGSCGHDTHLVKVEKCNLSHLILHHDQVVFSNSYSHFIYAHFFTNERLISGLTHPITVRLPSRAPPVLS